VNALVRSLVYFLGRLPFSKEGMLTGPGTVVLVHGGFVDGSGWQGVYGLLKEFHDSFAADVAADLAAFMADSQVTWDVDALGGTISEAAWRSKPSWYVLQPEVVAGIIKKAASEVRSAAGLTPSLSQANFAVPHSVARRVSRVTSRRGMESRRHNTATQQTSELDQAEMPRTKAALAYTEARHRGQRREADDVPFVAHPIEVAALLEECGYTDHVIAAAVLHDVLEDTDAERQELEEQFGDEIATLVAALTDDPSIRDEAERKAALRLQVSPAGEPVPAIFAADKISKAREVRLLASQQQVDGPLALKVEPYRESLEMLEQIIPGHTLVDKLRIEIDALESQLEVYRG
jgi:hypothetical protein